MKKRMVRCSCGSPVLLVADKPGDVKLPLASCLKCDDRTVPKK